MSTSDSSDTQSEPSGDSATVAMSQRTKQARYAALIGWNSLLAVMALWHFAFPDTHQYSVLFVFLLYLLPLLLLLPGMVRARPYTHAVGSFVSMIYLLHASTVLYTDPHLVWLALSELVAATVFFCGCSYYARLRGRELGTALPKLSKVMQEEREFFENKS